MTMAQPPLGPRMPMRNPNSNQSDHGHFSSGGGPRPRLGYLPYRPYIRPPPQGGDFTANNEYDGRRLRKSLVRKTVDYNSAIIKLLQVLIPTLCTEHLLSHNWQIAENVLLSM